MSQAHRISPHSLGPDLSLAPDFYCRFGPTFGAAIGPMLSLGERGARFLDGWRDIAARQTDSRVAVPVYRQSHILPFRVRPTPELWDSPGVAESAPIPEPGDLIVNKFPPIRAAWVTPRCHRHPVDANCILVKGLAMPVAFWAALCINHSRYEAILLRTGGLSGRVSLQSLRALRIADPPEEAGPLSRRVWEHLERDLATQARFAALMREVESTLAAGVGPVELERDAASWWLSLPASALEDSLLPLHLRSVARHGDRVRRFGWAMLEELLSDPRQDGQRLRELPTNGSYLRLGDVGPALTVVAPDEAPTTAPEPRHVYREPLEADECLVSALVSQGRIAFAGRLPDRPVWVTDNWFRLRFRETPGAGALLLNSEPILEQLRALAVGTAQQFIRPGWTRRVFLPRIERETRIRWCGELHALQRERFEVEQDWGRLSQESERLYAWKHGVGMSWPENGEPEA